MKRRFTVLGNLNLIPGYKGIRLKTVGAVEVALELGLPRKDNGVDIAVFEERHSSAQILEIFDRYQPRYIVLSGANAPFRLILKLKHKLDIEDEKATTLLSKYPIENGEFTGPWNQSPREWYNTKMRVYYANRRDKEKAE